MTTPTRRFLRKRARLFFKPAARYPADPRAVFILALSVFGGLTALLLDAAPDTLNSVLPHWSVLIWGILLTAGSALTLFGMARQTVSGIILEQVGSVIVGSSTLYYSLIALAVVGPNALQSLIIVAAWGVACFIRWIQLQALISDGQRKAALNELDREIIRRINDDG